MTSFSCTGLVNPQTGLLDSIYEPVVPDFIITGTGFGSKSSTAYFDNFENRNLGAVSGSVGEINWSNSNGSSISDSLAHSGTRAVRHNYSSNDFPKAYKTLSGTSRYCRYSCYLHFSGTVAAGTVWKMARIGGNEVYGGDPHAGASYISSGGVGNPVSYGGEITINAGTITASAGDMVGQNSTPADAFIQSQWLFYELIFDAGTIDGSNCLFEERVNNKIVTRWQNEQFLTSTNSQLPQWALLPINGLDNSPAIVYTVDEFYIDESLSRVVMTDNATYSLSTNFAEQPVVEWSDTEIGCLYNRSGFTIGQTAYRHIFVNNAIVRTDEVVVS